MIGRRSKKGTTNPTKRARYRSTECQPVSLARPSSPAVQKVRRAIAMCASGGSGLFERRSYTYNMAIVVRRDSVPDLERNESMPHALMLE